MRLTNTMMINNLVSNLGLSSGKINSYSNQLQTGRKYQLPSEAPVAAAKSIRYKSSISKNEQYTKNVEDANELLKVSESALDSYNEILTRVKELSSEAANVTFSDSDRQAVTAEIQQLKSEAIRIANTSYNGRYLFSGYKTDEKLLNEDGTYAIDVISKDGTHQEEDPANPGTMITVVDKAETINYDIGFGGKIQVNTLGTSVFGDANVGEKAGIISMFDKLLSGLSSGDLSKINEAAGEADSYQQIELDAIADIGARMNRLSLTKNRLENNLTNLETAQSLNDDTDYAETITKLTNQKSIYQAALAVGAQVIQPTLLDYL